MFAVCVYSFSRAPRYDDGMPKRLAKAVLYGIFLVAVWPAAAMTAFGRWKAMYSIFAHLFSLSPGIWGDYLRTGFYRLTLFEWPLSSRIQFGSFFAHPEVRVGPHVYIGSYCILGRTEIGGHTQIASGVQVLSGRHQHVRDESGRISGAESGVFSVVSIGPNCWIGAGAIVMANVGAGSTIGAGSVVTKPIPAGVTAVGSPADVIKAAIKT